MLTICKPVAFDTWQSEFFSPSLSLSLVSPTLSFNLNICAMLLLFRDYLRQCSIDAPFFLLTLDAGLLFQTKQNHLSSHVFGMKTTKEERGNKKRIKSLNDSNCCNASSRVIKKIFIIWIAANLTYMNLSGGALPKQETRLCERPFKSFLAKANERTSHSIYYHGKMNFHFMSLFISFIFINGAIMQWREWLPFAIHWRATRSK